MAKRAGKVHLRRVYSYGGPRAGCGSKSSNLSSVVDELTCKRCFPGLGGEFEASEADKLRYRVEQIEKYRAENPGDFEYAEETAQADAPDIVDHDKAEPDHDESAAVRGRPAYPPGMARTEVVRVRLTPAELAAVKSRADKAGDTVSAYLRRSALDTRD